MLPPSLLAEEFGRSNVVYCPFPRTWQLLDSGGNRLYFVSEPHSVVDEALSLKTEQDYSRLEDGVVV